MVHEYILYILHGPLVTSRLKPSEERGGENHVP